MAKSEDVDVLTRRLVKEVCLSWSGKFGDLSVGPQGGFRDSICRRRLNMRLPLLHVPVTPNDGCVESGSGSELGTLRVGRAMRTP